MPIAGQQAGVGVRLGTVSAGLESRRASDGELVIVINYDSRPPGTKRLLAQRVATWGNWRGSRGLSRRSREDLREAVRVREGDCRAKGVRVGAAGRVHGVRAFA